MHRAAHWKEWSDEGLLAQPHASPFHLPPFLLVRTEPLLDESLGTFSLANETTGKADGWWFRRSRGLSSNGAPLS